MKKLVLFFAIATVVAFSACKKTQEAPAVEPVQTEEAAPAQEEVTPDSTATEAPAETPAETPAQ